MLPANKADTVADRLWIFGLAALLPITAMWLLGFDANWDLRNYHLYNVHAWFTGRMDIDIAPAQSQTWHNPLLDVPMYLIVTSGLAPRWSSAWLTIPTMASLFFLLRLQRTLSSERPTRISQVVLALIALTGAATYGTLALSMNDGFVAAGILGSLWLLLGRDMHDDQKRWLVAGLLAGAIAGLKLTAAPYCIGLACAALINPDWTQRARRLVTLGVGGVVGLAVTYAYWGWHLWTTRGNPVFPYYNNVFQSPDALALPWVDIRFRPESLLDALLTPIHLLSLSQQFSEPKLSDPRLLAGIVGLIFLYILHRRSDAALRHRFAILLAFFVGSFLVWRLQYGIYRYAIALELIGSLALVLLLQQLPRGRAIALLIAFVLVSADTKRPDWGHVKVSAPGLGMTRPNLPPDALIVIASEEPVAYFALALPDDVPMIAIKNNFLSPGQDMRLQLQAERRLRDHPGPILLLRIDADVSGQALLDRHYGLRQGGVCIPLISSIGNALLCPQLSAAEDGLDDQRQP